MKYKSFNLYLGTESLLIPFLDAFPFPAFLLDEDHQILLANNKLLDDLNAKREQVVGHYCSTIIHNTILPINECPLGESIEKGIPVERKYYDKNLNKWILSTVFPINWKTKDDKILFLHFIQDISNITKVENLNLEENERYKELIKANKEIIVRVSHELQTPISTISLAVQLLLEQYRDQLSVDVVNLIELILKGELRLKKLIDDIISVSKVDSGNIKLSLQKENLIELLNDCVEEIFQMANQRRISIEMDLPESLYLEYDKFRIEQVVFNLLSNAIKYTPPNGKIFITLKEDSNFIDLSITDTGIGLTKEEQGAIFKKYGRIERDNSKFDIRNEGAGLGLYISKELIKLHGFQLWVNSEGRNKGSTFTIRMGK